MNTSNKTVQAMFKPEYLTWYQQNIVNVETTVIDMSLPVTVHINVMNSEGFFYVEQDGISTYVRFDFLQVIE